MNNEELKLVESGKWKVESYLELDEINQKFRHSELDSESKKQMLNQVQHDKITFNSPLSTFNSQKRAAFTLAEVLITLGVIGVVAALTMPTLIANYQKQVTVTQLKKAYSEFSQVLQKAEVEHGSMQNWDFANFDTPIERVNYFGDNYLFPNLTVVKKCSPTTSECWADDVESLKSGLLAEQFQNSSATHASFIAAPGYSVYYWLHGTGDGMWYVVDINGLKKPNMLGKDIFPFLVYWGNHSLSGRVYPYGLYDDNGARVSRNTLLKGEGLEDVRPCCRTTGSQLSGRYCAAVIFLDGWKIADDYPW